MTRTLAFLLLAVGASSATAQSCPDAPPQTAGAIEIVSYGLTDGVTSDEFLSAAAGTMPYLCAQDGFISRQLSVGEDGRWTDYVHWTTQEAATAAFEAAMTQDAVLSFFMTMDEPSIALRYEKAMPLAGWEGE